MLNSLDNKETKIWDEFVSLAKEKTSPMVHMWIDSLVPALPLEEKSENDIFLMKSNQSFAINFLQQKHLTEIENALEEATGLKRAVRLVLDENLKTKKPKTKQTKEQKEHIETAKKMEDLAQMHSFCGLNLKYTFDNFVVGENSKFAYKIAQMIAEAPGQKYNPLFLSSRSHHDSLKARQSNIYRRYNSIQHVFPPYQANFFLLLRLLWEVLFFAAFQLSTAVISDGFQYYV